LTRILTSLVAITVLSATVVSAEVIDRVLAVVSGQVITKSDVDMAAAFGIAADLQSLIDRTLMLNEVRRVAPPDPPAADVQAHLAGMRGRFGTADAFARALAASGVEEASLGVFVADDLRLAAYLDGRFSAASQPTDAEIRQAGETERERLTNERRQALIAAWLAELRRRADITVLQ
jgi:hypothetical protein